MSEVSIDPDTIVTAAVVGAHQPGAPLPWCETCGVYFRKRRTALVDQILVEAARRRMAPPLLAAIYKGRVHNRHLSGLSLETS